MTIKSIILLQNNYLGWIIDMEKIYQNNRISNDQWYKGVDMKNKKKLNWWKVAGVAAAIIFWISYSIYLYYHAVSPEDPILRGMLVFIGGFMVTSICAIMLIMAIELLGIMYIIFLGGAYTARQCWSNFKKWIYE